MINYRRLNMIIFITGLSVISLWYTWWKELKDTQAFMEGIKNIEMEDLSESDIGVSEILGRFEAADIELEGINCYDGKMEVNGIYHGSLEEIVCLIEKMKGDDKSILKDFSFDNSQCSFSIIFYNMAK